MILRDRGITLSQQEIAARVGVQLGLTCRRNSERVRPRPLMETRFRSYGLDYLRSHTPWIALFKDFGTSYFTR